MKPVFAAAFTALFFWTAIPSGLGQEPLKPLPATPPTVTLLPLLGLTLVDSRTYRYDAGPVDAVRTPKFERTFTLKNDTRQPVTIARLRGSCGCETLLLQQGGKQTPTVRLNPGEEADIHLAVALHGGQSGPARKYVWVDGSEGAGQSSPLVTLEVDLTLRQSVLFTPGSLNFGKVEAGEAAPLPLTVSVDADLLPSPALPPLQSADPDVQVKAVGTVQRVEEGGRSLWRQNYQVLLSASAPAGRVSCDLLFATPHSPGVEASPLAGVSVSVAGTVSGTLDAMPATVFFGSLPAGRSVRRSVVLSVPSLLTARSLSASGDAPWLQASLASSSPSAKRRLLTVILTDKAPPGPIQGKVTVIATGGQRLVIPVIAELTK